METELRTAIGDDLATIDCAFDLSDETGIRSAIYRADDLILRCESLIERRSTARFTMQEYADLLAQIPMENCEERSQAYEHVQNAETNYRSPSQKLRVLNAELQQAQRRLHNTLSAILPTLSEPEYGRMQTCVEQLSNSLHLIAFREVIHDVTEILNNFLTTPIARITWNPPPDPPVVSRPRVIAAQSQPQKTPLSLHEHEDETDEEQPLDMPHGTAAVRAWLEEGVADMRHGISLIISFTQSRENAIAQAQNAAEHLRDLPIEDENAEDEERDHAHECLQRAEAAYHRLTRQSLDQQESVFSAQRTLRRRLQALLTSPFLSEHNDPEGHKREAITGLLPSLRRKISSSHLNETLREVDRFLAQMHFCPMTVEQGTSAERKEEIKAHIRWMIRRDRPEVLGIEAESFEYPWLEEDFERCLKQRNCIGMVAEHDDRVVGFMIYELNKTRIHVLNFAVATGERHRGVASQMLVKLIEKLSLQRRSRITLEVRETNLVAQLCFRKNGFRVISALRDFYDDTREDAYLMQYRYRSENSPVRTFI